MRYFITLLYGSFIILNAKLYFYSWSRVLDDDDDDDDFYDELLSLYYYTILSYTTRVQCYYYRISDHS